MKFSSIIIISFLLLSSCNNKNKEYLPINTSTTLHHVKVKEVLQTGSYTFLFVNENDQEYWMAVSKINAEIEDDFYYEDALVMKDFESKELNKVFNRILFVDYLSRVPTNTKSETKSSLNHVKANDQELTQDIKVERAPGGITIAELYKNRNDYADKKVIIRGQVVKINNGIMNRNWIHLKDGTSDSGKSDLTFTTKEEVNIGDIIIFEGTVALNKEYGAGYIYPLIVENASLK